MNSIECSQHSVDSIKYTVDDDLLLRHLNFLRKLSDGQQLTPNELDEQIMENENCVTKMTTEISEQQNEHLKLENELRALQSNDARAKHTKHVHDDAIETTCNEWIRTNANDLSHAARLLETRLGLKCKLTTCDDNDNPNNWLAKFLFDPDAVESSKYVVLQIDETKNHFTLLDMKPMPQRFRELQQLLERTNDATGLLSVCYRSFNSC